jgi:hypothetical protein
MSAYQNPQRFCLRISGETMLATLYNGLNVLS